MGRQILGLLRLFGARVSDLESNAEVAKLVNIPEKWSAGHDAFREIRRRFLEATKAKDHPKCVQYGFEETCLQAIYNSTCPIDPFDPGSPYFVPVQAIGLARILKVPDDEVIAILLSQSK
jgi:hypothetical protein